MASNKQHQPSKQDVAVVQQYIKRFNAPQEKMFVEDLAALEKLTEETIVEELKQRMHRGDSYTFIGDVLVSLNSNELPSAYDRSVFNLNKIIDLIAFISNSLYNQPIQLGNHFQFG